MSDTAEALAAQLALLRREHRAALAELQKLRAACATPPTRCELADALRVSERTVSRWRRAGLPSNATATEAAAWLKSRRRKCPKLSRREN